MLRASLAPSQSVAPLTESARRRRALRLGIRGAQIAILGATQRARVWEQALDVVPDDPIAQHARARAIVRVMELKRRLRVLRRAERAIRGPETVTASPAETVSQPPNGDSQPVASPPPPPVAVPQSVTHYNWF